MQRKHITPNDLSEQGELQKSEVSQTVNFHSHIFKVNKWRSIPSAFPLNYIVSSCREKREENWYWKKNLPYEDAIREVVAQEFFRLFISNQPKTRLVEPNAEASEDEMAVDEVSEEGQGKYGVISKEVEGYKPLSDLAEVNFEKTNLEEANLAKANLAKMINSGEIYGLGEILVISMLVYEADLKLDNLCLNSENQIIKIDGDSAFFSLFPKFPPASITEADLQELPKVSTYQPTNWLDFYRCENNKPVKYEDPFLTNTLVQSKRLRAEINRALLKVLIMPLDVIKQFMGGYIDNKEEEEKEHDLIIRHKKMLDQAALKNESFRRYLLSPKAKKDADEFIKYLNEFKTTGKNELNITADGMYMQRQLTRHRNVVVAQEKTASHGLFGKKRERSVEEFKRTRRRI